MKENAPFIVRFVLELNRVIAAMGRVAVMARDEALWVWTSQAGRERANRAIYGGLKTYAPGGGTFEAGLFDWERNAIASSFPSSGRILLGAAGGGRELEALCHMGYEVVAFEPAPALADAARNIAKLHPTSEVITASFADLVLAAETGSGPLAPHICGRDFAGIILGWTSFSYVWRRDRERLLQSLRRLVPGAPVLLSYLAPGEEVQGAAVTSRRWFRHLLRLTGARTLAEPGDAFLPWAGFYQTLTAEEIRSLGARTGYKVLASENSEMHNAVLVPDGTAV